jgi:tRNA dimethylallyltransferase
LVGQEVKPIVVVGPTASGKSELAAALARELGGEVISADSRQIYRGLNAGTAKPGYPCHLVDIIEPSVKFSAAEWAARAKTLLAAAKKPMIVAGGTGLYVKALLEGLSDMPPRDESVRAKIAGDGDARELHAKLRAVDPAAAAKIPPGNTQRLIRALEVYELTGLPISAHWGKRKGGVQARLVLRLDWPPETLRLRIAERAKAMWPGMIEEASAFEGGEPGLESLGYREAWLCSRGKLSKAEGFDRLVSATNAYAKRQRTWFRTQLPGAVTVPGGPLEEMTRRSLEALHEAAAA